MSNDATNLVWEYSKHRGTRRVLMLALADHVNPEKGNVAWPGISRLAMLARTSERHVKRELRVLEDSRELKIMRNQGPHKRNLYKICLPLSDSGDIPVTRDAAENSTGTFQANTGDARVTQSVKEPLTERTPIVPKGDDAQFWISVAFECFGQTPRPIAARIVKSVGNAALRLDRIYAESLKRFYAKPLNTDEWIYKSQKQSPERLLLNLENQVSLSRRLFPIRRKIVYDFTLEDLHAYLTEKYGNCRLPRSLDELEQDPVGKSIREEFLRDRKKHSASEPTTEP